MKGFIGFTKRNLLIYFKDIYGVIFSLLTSIILFVLYLLFLKGTFVDAIEGSMGALKDIISSNDVKMFVNGTLLVGIMGSALVTVPYACLQTIVRDREKKVDCDVSATPLKRWQIIVSYFVAALISAFIIVGLIYTIGLFILNSMGDLHMDGSTVLASYGVIFLGAFSATALFMIIVMCFKNSSTGSAFFGILSAASGFVIGAYIPISQFSEGIQTACNLFPASHITILIRNMVLKGVLNSMNETIGGLDNGLFTEEIKRVFTFNPLVFGKSLGTEAMVIYVSLISLLCIAVMILIYERSYKRR